MFDLAVHTAKPGRSRAIDRYARAAGLSPGTDEAFTLEAMQAARFAIWRIERHHEAAGLIVRDVLRDHETWLLDEGLAASTEPGFVFAARLCRPDDFAMTCGVIVPVDEEFIQQVVSGGMAWLPHSDPDGLADDPRFAAAIYRAALSDGIMDYVAFREPGIAA